jgi:hypothetical protein
MRREENRMVMLMRTGSRQRRRFEKKKANEGKNKTCISR